MDIKKISSSLNNVVEEMLSAKITVNPYGENVTSNIKK
jgi:hypothetical protein